MKKYLVRVLIFASILFCLCAVANAAITLPDSLQIIDVQAFYGDTSIGKVIVPEGTTEIRSKAFAHSSLTKLVLPASLTFIAEDAFEGCGEITVDVPEGCYAYEQCAALGLYIGIITEETQAECFTYSLINDKYCEITGYIGIDTDVVIPATIDGYVVKRIADNAFEGQTALTSVTLPEGITDIGWCAFYKCIGLKTIKLPDTVANIDNNAFSDCTSLIDIVLPDGISCISNRMLSNCSSLTSITIPSSVVKIGESAFSCCSNLVSITLNDGLTSLGGGAFWMCSSLTEIVIPETVKAIGDFAFGYCSNLTSITLPQGLTCIPDMLFENCENLKSIAIPESIISIGRGAFEFCSSLSEIILPESVEEIGDNAFDHCTSLTSIVLPERISNFGTKVFRYCSSLRSVTLPKGITSISDYAFDNCSSLESIIIPEGVTSIGTCAFFCCESLESIDLPDSLIMLGESAFRTCTSLKSIVIPESVSALDWYAFAFCQNLTSIYIPKSVTFIDEEAFYFLYPKPKLTIYGESGSYAETYAATYGIPFIATQFPYPTPTPVPICSLSGTVTLSDGAPLPGTAVIVVSTEDEQLNYVAYTNDEGTWSIKKLPAGTYTVAYALQGYTFTPESVVASAGDSLSAVGSLNGVEDGTVTFTMTYDGKAVTTIATGAAVQFAVFAPNAQAVRILVDGTPYNEYTLNDGQATLSRAFTKAGTRSIQFQAFANDQWGSVSAAQTLTVTAAGDLEKAVIHSIPAQYVDKDMLLSWSAVEHAENYTVYLYDGDTLLWPISASHTADSTTTQTSITIPGKWLMHAGPHSVNVVAFGANYNQSTAAADFVVEATDTVCITYPEDGDTHLMGNSVQIKCAAPSTVKGVRVQVVSAQGETRWLAPDEKGSFVLQLDAIASYMLTPYYSIAEGDFTADNATGQGESITIHAALPQIHGLRMNGYTSYAYYMSGDAVAPLFTGRVEDGVTVQCQVVTASSNANGAAPVCTGNFTNEEGSLTFAWQSSALTEEGRYQYTFTPVFGGVTGEPVSFTVYIMTAEEASIRYGSQRTQLLARPDDITGRPLTAGTQLMVKGSWGAMAYVTTGTSEGFVEKNTLIESLTPAETKIVSVEGTEQEFIPQGSSRTLRFTVQGHVAELVMSVHTTQKNKFIGEYHGVQDADNPQVFTVELPLENTGMYYCSASLGTDSGDRVDDSWGFCYVSYDKHSINAGERVYAKYLDVKWTKANGDYEYLGWDDPADYIFTYMGAAPAVSSAEKNHFVFRIAAKDGSAEYWRCLDVDTEKECMRFESTEDVEKKAVVVCFYMDKTAGTVDYENGFEEDIVGKLHRADYVRLFEVLDIKTVFLEGPKSLEHIYSFMQKQINAMDYNDELYICVAGHGSKTVPYGFGYCQDGAAIMAAIASLRQYTNHYLNCRYIIDACYSGRFDAERAYTYIDSSGNRKNVYPPLLASAPPDKMGKWHFFSERLAEFVSTNYQAVYTLDELAYAISWDRWVNAVGYGDPDKNGTDIFFRRD